MPVVALNDIGIKELFPGFDARLIHTDGMTIGYIYIKKGSSLPTHHHIHEQVSNVLEGEFKMTIDGITTLLKPGNVAVIPSNIPHGGVAITYCLILDVFNPTRKDYR